MTAVGLGLGSRACVGEGEGEGWEWAGWCISLTYEHSSHPKIKNQIDHFVPNHQHRPGSGSIQQPVCCALLSILCTKDCKFFILAMASGHFLSDFPPFIALDWAGIWLDLQELLHAHWWFLKNAHMCNLLVVEQLYHYIFKVSSVKPSTTCSKMPLF